MISKLQKICAENNIQYDGAVSLDGEQLGDMCVREVDDIVYNRFKFYYKGKPIKHEDLEIIVHSKFDPLRWNLA